MATVEDTERARLERLARLVSSASLQDLTEAAWPAFQEQVAGFINKGLQHYMTQQDNWVYKGPCEIINTGRQEAAQPHFGAGFTIKYSKPGRHEHFGALPSDQVRHGWNKFQLFGEFHTQGRPARFAILKSSDEGIIIGIYLQTEYSTDVWILGNWQ
ncbi:MAG: hypothetical protein HYT16_00900 [DPANN group archaeon]|nr:hypothetical protein [DPANN group archaeon]